MLRIEHLTKNYGEKKAVDDLNLHIAPGEIYGFIGHNGAGKTKTLKSVAGILQFDAGQIYPDAAVGMQAQLCLYENPEYHPEIGKAWNDFEQNRLRFQRDRRADGSVVGTISMALGAGTVQSCGNTPKRLR